MVYKNDGGLSHHLWELEDSSDGARSENIFVCLKYDDAHADLHQFLST
jgi:hypothetical protein